MAREHDAEDFLGEARGREPVGDMDRLESPAPSHGMKGTERGALALKNVESTRPSGNGVASRKQQEYSGEGNGKGGWGRGGNVYASGEKVTARPSSAPPRPVHGGEHTARPRGNFITKYPLAKLYQNLIPIFAWSSTGKKFGAVFMLDELLTLVVKVGFAMRLCTEDRPSTSSRHDGCRCRR